MREIMRAGAWGILFGLAVMATASAQNSQPASASDSISVAPASPQISASDAALQTYAGEQQTLMEERQALMAQGATAQQLQAWARENSARISAQRQNVQAMAQAAAVQPVPANTGSKVAANTSPALKSFLALQARLAQARAQIQNQAVAQASASGTGLTSAQVTKLEQQETKLFRQQNAMLVAQDSQQLKSMTPAAASTLQKVPVKAIIPPNVTPQLAALLNARNKLRQQEVALNTQYANATPAVRMAALKKWHQQNATQIAQLHQQAATLSTTSTTNSTQQD